MLLQCGAQLVLVYPVRQMLGRERQAQFHTLVVETAQLALLRELLGDAADLELIGEHRPVAIERLARYARRCRRGVGTSRAGPGRGGGRCGRVSCPRGFRLFFCRQRRRNGAHLRRAKSQHAHQAHAEAGILIRRKRQVAPPVQRDLVIQLQFFGVELLRQSQDALALGQVRPQGLGRALRQSDLMQQRGQVLQRAVERKAARLHFVGDGEHRLDLLLRQSIQQLEQIILVDCAQHGAHRFLAHFAAGIGDGLIEQRQRVAHAALRGLGDQPQRRRLGGGFFLLQDVSEMGVDRLARHLLQIELQATRQHRDRYFLRIGGGEDELDVLGWLLESFQHRIECLLGQHMHFVDDEYLEAPARRRIDRVVLQFAHVVDAGVGGSVDLDQVDEAAAVDLGAGGANAAWGGSDAGLAVERLGKNARERGLAHAARAGEQIGMVQPLLLQRMGERAHHVFLPHQGGEITRAPLAREDLVTHAEILPASRGLRRKDS